MRINFAELAFFVWCNIYGVIPLHEAVKNNDIIWVESLIVHSNECPINDLDHHGYSALHYAVEAQNKFMVRELLKHNPNTDIENNNGETALDIAKNRGYKEIELLFEDLHAMQMMYFMPPPMIDVSYESLADQESRDLDKEFNSSN